MLPSRRGYHRAEACRRAEGSALPSGCFELRSERITREPLADEPVQNKIIRYYTFITHMRRFEGNYDNLS